MIPIAKREPWMDWAACRGINPDLFFPEQNDNSSGLNAKRVCAGCVVVKQCLDYADREHIYDGIFGGLNGRERQRRRRQLRLRTGAPLAYKVNRWDAS